MPYGMRARAVQGVDRRVFESVTSEEECACALTGSLFPDRGWRSKGGHMNGHARTNAPMHYRSCNEEMHLSCECCEEALMPSVQVTAT